MFLKLIKLLQNLTYLLFLSLFLLLSTFSAFLKSLSNYYFRWLAYKSFLSRFSVLINVVFQVFQSPGFAGSRFCKVQVLQGPGFSGSSSRSSSRVWVQLFEVTLKRNVALCDFEKNKNDKLLSQINNNCNETSCNFISPENNVLLQSTITAVENEKVKVF